MNELHAVLAWVAGMDGDLACGICQVLNRHFDNLLSLGIGAAAAAGAAAGTVAGGAARARRAARDARDAFNENYERESGRGDTDQGTQFPPPFQGGFGRGSGQFPPPFQGGFGRGSGQFPPPFQGGFGRGSGQFPTTPPMTPGTLSYFSVGFPPGPQIEGQPCRPPSRRHRDHRFGPRTRCGS